MFFAGTADRANTRSRDVELPAGASIEQLSEFLMAEFPLLGDLRLVYAVNEQYMLPGQLLNDGDEVAVFTPVSGG